MEKQQVQLTRMIFADEIPQEVERLFRRVAVTLSHETEEPLIELTNLLEQQNYTAFLQKSSEFKDELVKALMLLQDCSGILTNFIHIKTQPEQQHQQHQHDHHHDHEKQQAELKALMESMGTHAQKTQSLKSNLESMDVQEG